MIVAFRTASQGLGRGERMAEGIYLALMTTAAGLTIAIPTLLLSAIFTARVERFFREMAEELVDEVVGGGDGAPTTVTVYRDGKPYVPEHLSKDQDISIAVGDMVAVCTPGGGGFGDAYARDPALVLKDVARGYYTVAQARELFGVVLCSDLSDVDAVATKALRETPQRQAG